MAGFDYAKAEATAKKLIAKFGTTSAVKRSTKSGSAHKPTLTPSYTNVIAADIGIKNVLLPGKTTRESRHTLVISTSAGLSPVHGDQVAIGVPSASVDASTVFAEIDVVAPLKPAGTTLLYEVYLVL